MRHQTWQKETLIHKELVNRVFQEKKKKKKDVGEEATVVKDEGNFVNRHTKKEGNVNKDYTGNLHGVENQRGSTQKAGMVHL